MRRKGWKRCAATVMAAAVAIGIGAAAYLPSAADAPIDLASACAVTAKPGIPEYAEDLALADVVIDLYRVADAVKVDGYDTYTYELRGPYAALRDSILDGDGMRTDLDNQAWQEIEQRAARIALGGPDVPAGDAEDDSAENTPEKPADTPVVSGVPMGEMIRQTDDGENLSCGLYLLVARGQGLENDVIEIEPDDGGASVLATVAQSERYVYTCTPVLVSIPDKEDENGDGVVNTADPSPWIYDRDVYLKLERDYRLGRLEIVKTLESYESKSPATFVFRIDASLEDGWTYSDVVGLDFSAPGQQRYVVENLPVGAKVTVTEIYSGATYELTTEASVDTVIEAENMVQAAFTNTYSRKNRDGHGVTNGFTYDGEAWQWNAWTDETE